MFAYLYVHVFNICMFVQTWLVLFWRRYILVLLIIIGIIIFVSVIWRGQKLSLLLFSYIVAKIPKGYSSNSSNIIDFVFLRTVLLNMVSILMMSAKMATLGLFKIRNFFKNRLWRHNFCTWRHQQNFTRHSNYNVNVVMWPKFTTIK